MEVAAGDEFAVGGVEGEEGGVEEVGDFGVIGWGCGGGGGEGAFAAVASEGGAAGFLDDVVGDLEEPAGHALFLRGFAGLGFFEEDEEDGLGDVGGEVGVFGLAECGGVDEVGVLGGGCGVGVGRCGHGGSGGFVSF